MSVDHPVAVVSGGGTGIGAAITKRLNTVGYKVVIIQQTAALAQAYARSLSSPTRVVEHVGADLRHARACRLAIEQVGHRFGRIDVLVNCAGVTGAGALAPLADYTDEQIDDIFDVNVKAPLRLTSAAVPFFSTSGVIVNISSVAARTSQSHAVAYGASKAALEEMTRQMALELAPRGVRCVYVAPGDIAVPPAGDASTAAGPALARHTPLGRRGEPEDIADAVLWLCDAPFVTGTGIVVDGGWSAL